MKRVVLAYSGGVDSNFLLHAAVSTLGKENVLAVTAVSESFPENEKCRAAALAKKAAVGHQVIRTRELSNKNFRKNPVNRCYYCKKELFGRLKRIAAQKGFNFVIDGSTRDDLKDTRYGAFAAKEAGVKSPLQEARLGKDEIRRLSKRMGLETWNRPSYACLASRFAYGEEITSQGLRSVGKAEAYLKGLGLDGFRVRRHGRIARIEVARSDIGRLLKKGTRDRISKKLKSLGFVYVALDLEGYRPGSMHEET